MGRLEESLRDFERAIQLEPKNGMFYCHRGLTYYDLGEKEKAIQDYTQALDIIVIPKQRFKPYFNRGNAYREIGKLRESIKDLQAAMELETT